MKASPLTSVPRLRVPYPIGTILPGLLAGAGAAHRLRPLDLAQKRMSDPPFAARTERPADDGLLAVT